MPGRRQPSGRAAAGLALASLALGFAACSTGRDEPSSGDLVAPVAVTRPNVILIVTDDQDVPSMDDMPSVRRHLTDVGITFHHAYATTPICCPERVSILRGQYAHNHRVMAVNPPYSGFGRFHDSGGEASTIATWLDDAGYYTFFAGKYLNGYAGAARGVPATYIPPGWDWWFGDLAPQDYFDYKVNDNGTVVEYGEKPEDYLTDVLTEESVAFIRAASEQGDPFFMYVAPFAPHDSPPIRLPIPAPRHAETFAGREMPKGPSFNEADVEDKHPLIRSRPLLTEEQIAAIDHHHRLRLQSLLAVDDMVEAIFATLAAAGQLERTYVFYTTDNGFHLGQHRVPTGKGLPYEEDIIVPLVVAGPGLEKARRDHLVLLSDLAPTIAELTGAEVPSFVDGRSIVPLLGADAPALESWRQAFLTEYWLAKKDAPDRLIWRGIRTNDHKYIEWGGGVQPPELYEVEIDPFELENRRDDADSELLAGFAAWLEALFTCAGETCRSLEDAPPAAR